MVKIKVRPSRAGSVFEVKTPKSGVFAVLEVIVKTFLYEQFTSRQVLLLLNDDPETRFIHSLVSLKLQKLSKMSLLLFKEQDRGYIYWVNPAKRDFLKGLYNKGE
ncbi:hypothetical protein KY333_05200 [Candidatus Woesearchaeota archaeon]|nr:hypothetical protein [Candidatus Woesearchaeota archaeon]